MTLSPELIAECAKLDDRQCLDLLRALTEGGKTFFPKMHSQLEDAFYCIFSAVDNYHADLEHAIECPECEGHGRFNYSDPYDARTTRCEVCDGVGRCEPDQAYFRKEV